MKYSAVLNDTRQLTRLIWLTSAAVIVVGLAFAGYYYWDRYVAIGDQSPIQLGAAELEHAVRENPEDPEVRLSLAQFYFQSNMYSKALSQSREILSLFPENDGAMFLAAMSHVQLGETEAAVELFEPFIEIRREAPMAGSDDILETALYFLGDSYIKLDRPSDAIPVLSEALEINYTDADAMYQLGLAYTQTGQHELALAQYHNAVRFVPDFTEAYHGMIASYTALDQEDYVAYARGMEALSLEDYQTARTHLQYATNKLPDFMPAYLGAGLAFEQNGDLEVALRYLTHASELDPDNFLATNSLRRVQLALDTVQQ